MFKSKISLTNCVNCGSRCRHFPQKWGLLWIFCLTWPACLHPPDGHRHHFSTSCPAVGCWPPSVCGEAAAIFTISSLTTQLDTNISTVIPKYKKSWKYATYEGCLKITRLGSWIINRASHAVALKTPHHRIEAWLPLEKFTLWVKLQIIKPGF